MASDPEDSTTSRGSRIKFPTEKGEYYKLQLLKDQSSAAKRSWRKQLNKISNLVVDSVDLGCLTSERVFLEKKMEILNAANERLLDFLADNFDEKKQELSKIEALETEHSSALRRINERIAEIKQGTGSQRTQTSKRSSRSFQSRRSKESSVPSVGRKSAVAANVARLETDLKLAEAEARKTTALKEHEDDLKRPRLAKKMSSHSLIKTY